MGRTLRHGVAAGLIALGLCAAGGARAATTEIFLLDVDHCTGGCLPNAADNVTMTQNASALDFVVALFGGDEFKSTTSGQHGGCLIGLPRLCLGACPSRSPSP